MNSVILLGHRRVLWGTVMAAFLLSGFIVTMRSANLLWSSAAVSHVAHGLHSNPAASPNPESRIPNPGYGPPAVGLATTAGTAQPRLVEAYGKLPLSFEINKGQADSQVKFLSRGSGYSLFLTGNEAVLALRKGNSNGKRQMAKGVAQGSYFNPAVFPGLFAKPEAHQGGAAFPAFFRTPTAEFTDSAPDTGCRDKDLEKPQGLKGEPCATQAADALLRMKLVGANPNPTIVGTDELPGKSNYFIGSDPKKWRTNVSNYAKVKYANVYPGVDLVYYGNQGRLEYDFVVAPGADLRAITLELETGQSKIKSQKSKIDKNGDLVVTTDGGEVIFHKPVVYQPATYYEPRTKNQEPVEGKYAVKGDQVSFEVASYDKTRPLVIDPVLAYSTYLGGSGRDVGQGVAIDGSGNAYVTGSTCSSDFPTTTGAFQATYKGDGGCYWGGDAFVSKLNAAGSALVYSTYLGGSGDDSARGIALDASGNAYVTGLTYSSDFPTTPAAFQTVKRGTQGTEDAFVSKLNAAGSALLYSTYLGGSGDDEGIAIAVDASGNAYVTGNCTSSDFPTTPNALQSSYGGGAYDGYVSKLNAAGSALAYSTYLGGSNYDYGWGIAVDASGYAYVTGSTGSSNFPTTAAAFQTGYGGGGSDAFVSKLNPAGSALVYSTYLGGGDADGGTGIAVDASHNAYIIGGTGCFGSSGCRLPDDFPTTPGAFQTTYGGGNQDAFISKLNAEGSALIYSTYLGGSGDESFWFVMYGGIAVDASGNAWVTGNTSSSDFPTTSGALQATFGGGNCGSYTPCADAFVSKLNAAGSALLYSTYLGGSNSEAGVCAIAIDASANAYVAGSTVSSDFPTTSGALQSGLGSTWDAFVAKISPADAPGVALGPRKLSFRPQAVGTTSAPLDVTLLDAGSEPLSITSIVASGDFAQSNTCGSAVQPGKSCTLSVTFTPLAKGTRTGGVTITDNAAGSPHKLLLAGTGGGEPAVALTPANLTFAAEILGTTSPPQQVTLTNTGDAELDITSIATAGDFAQTNTCGSTVNPGASCTLNVTFTPTATGTRSGSITITDDAPGSPQKIIVTGTGVGAPLVTLKPASVPFQVLHTVGTTSLPQTVKLNNVGSGGLDITSITLTGPDGRDFAQSNNCPPTLAPGASCLVTITFTPTAQGVRTASVSITDNAPSSPQTVPMSGRGTFLKWAPRQMFMGDQPVGTSSPAQTVTLTNAGTAPITLYSIGIGGVDPGDFTQTNNCGSSLNPGASCTIQVTFTPTAVGGRLGHVAIRDSAFGGTHVVGLLGTGK